MNSRLKYILLLAITLSMFNCSDDDQNQQPLLKIVTPTQNHSVIEGDVIEIQVQANDPDGLIEKVSINYDGEVISETAVAPYNFTFDTSGLSEGEHEIIALVTDNSGLTNTSSLQVKIIANQQPILKILSPQNNDIMNRKEEVEIKVEVNDPDGTIKKVSMQVDDMLISDISTSPYIFVYDTSDLSAGTHTITIKAEDNKGLTNSESVDIVIKIDPPSFTSTIPFIGTTLVRIDGLVESYGNPKIEKRYFGICWNKSGTPTINDNTESIWFEWYDVINQNGNEDVFHGKIKGLELGTKYYARIYVDSPYTDEVYYGEEMSFTTANSYVSDSGTFIDSRDSNQYKWIKVGDQIWMAENVRYLGTAGAIINYNDPDPSDVSGCNIIFDKDEAVKNVNYIKYGCLYRPITGDVAPSGWHIATSSEWRDLIDYVGGSEVAGTILKSKEGWDSSDKPSGSDLSGFSVLPGGYKEYRRTSTPPYYCIFGTEVGPGKTTSFWTTSTVTIGRNQERVYVTFNHDEQSVRTGSSDIYDEFIFSGIYSIRCVKDTN